MTGNEFLNIIRSKGGFVRPDDMESLLSFYESKLLTATSADDEERIVASFGDPEVVIKKIKEEYKKLQLYTESEEPKTEPPAPPETVPESEDEDVKVFCQPEKAPEVKSEAPDETPAVKEETSPTAKTPPKHYGLANRILDKMKLRGDSRKRAAIALTVLFAPAFLLLALAIVALFLLAMAGIACAAVALMLIEAALILVSVVELIYAILAFFTSIPIALIELGLGTVLIALVVAVTALVYQLLTGVIPLAAKKVNALRKRSFQTFFELFYGSKGEK